MANTPETNVCRPPQTEAHEADLNDITLSKIPGTETAKDKELADTSFSFSRKQEQARDKQAKQRTQLGKTEALYKTSTKNYLKFKNGVSLLDYYVSLLAKILKFIERLILGDRNKQTGLLKPKNQVPLINPHALDTELEIKKKRKK